jgi:hypothetical protein
MHVQGGAAVLTPLMLELGVQPQVSSAYKHLQEIVYSR